MAGIRWRPRTPTCWTVSRWTPLATRSRANWENVTAANAEYLIGEEPLQQALCQTAVRMLRRDEHELARVRLWQEEVGRRGATRRGGRQATVSADWSLEDLVRAYVPSGPHRDR